MLLDYDLSYRCLCVPNHGVVLTAPSTTWRGVSEWRRYRTVAYRTVGLGKYLNCHLNRTAPPTSTASSMDADRPLHDDPSLRVPAVEVVDLSSAGGSSDGDDRAATNGSLHNGKPASTELGAEVSNNDEGSEDDSAWESESIYAEALEGMGDGHLFHGGERVQSVESVAAVPDLS